MVHLKSPLTVREIVTGEETMHEAMQGSGYILLYDEWQAYNISDHLSCCWQWDHNIPRWHDKVLPSSIDHYPTTQLVTLALIFVSENITAYYKAIFFLYQNL